MALLETLCNDLVKARAVNQTSNGYVSKVPTLVTPQGDLGTATGAAVLQNAATPNNVGQNLMGVIPYAAGSDNGTFSFRAIGWKKLKNGDVAAGAFLWVPVLLAEFACTVSATAAGVAGGVIGTGELFADTITQTYPPAATPSVEPVTNAADVVAHAVVDLKGCERFELSFTTGGSATSCNALVWKY